MESACVGVFAVGASGGVAQLGERVNGIHEVRGSIPLASTGLPRCWVLGSGCSVQGTTALLVSDLPVARFVPGTPHPTSITW